MPFLRKEWKENTSKLVENVKWMFFMMNVVGKPLKILNTLWVPLNFGKPTFSTKSSSKTFQSCAHTLAYEENLNFCCQFLPFCEHGFHVF